MGTDSEDSPQPPAGRGLARSSSRFNLSGGPALGRSTSKMGLAGMAGSAHKPGLHRSASRAQLGFPGAQDATGPTPGETAASSDAAPPPQTQPQPAPPQAAHHTPEVSSVPKLKRSRSMDQIETLKTPEVSEGQKAVESISGKVALPSSKPTSREHDPSHGPSPAAQASEHALLVEPASTPGSSAASDTASKPSLRAPFAPRHSAAAAAAAAGSAADHKSSPSQSPTSSPKNTSSPSNAAAPVPPPSSSPGSRSGSGETAALSARLFNLDHPAPRDDADALPEAEQRVDYFSHNWNESDIAGSWRYIISRRQDMANSARLENASWRMWAKAKNHLATVPPSTVNWLKDYDVTWLYGPLYHEPDSEYASNAASRGGSVSPGHTLEAAPHVSKHGCYPKSILKKKTLAQLMLEEAQELEQTTGGPSHVRSTTNYLRHHKYRPTPLGENRQIVADILNQQYKLAAAGQPDRAAAVAAAVSSGTGPASGGASLQGSEASSRASTPTGTPSRRPLSVRSLRSNRSSVTSMNTIERHVHFNDRVEQCMALDPDEGQSAAQEGRSAALGSTPQWEEPLDSEDDEDEEEEDNAGLFLGLRRPSVIDMKAHEKGANIIAALPATTLKYDDDEDEPERREEPVTVLLTSSRRPGFNAHYRPQPVQNEPEASYEIVDPTVHAVEFKAKTKKTDPETSRARVRPTASFG